MPLTAALMEGWSVGQLEGLLQLSTRLPDRPGGVHPGRRGALDPHIGACLFHIIDLLKLIRLRPILIEERNVWHDIEYLKFIMKLGRIHGLFSYYMYTEDV